MTWYGKKLWNYGTAETKIPPSEQVNEALIPSWEEFRKPVERKKRNEPARFSNPAPGAATAPRRSKKQVKKELIALKLGATQTRDARTTGAHNHASQLIRTDQSPEPAKSSHPLKAPIQPMGMEFERTKSAHAIITMPSLTKGGKIRARKQVTAADPAEKAPYDGPFGVPRRHLKKAAKRKKK
jgi:hypothetical protein